ncbi:MAG: hypothetical protein AAGB04_31215 [Pseudomonadota bacterium]
MKLTEEQEKMLTLAMSSSNQELIQAIGEQECNRVAGISQQEVAIILNLGRLRLREIFNEFREKLCKSNVEHLLNSADDSDVKKAILACLDILASSQGFIPALSASVLLSRGLLEEWCSNEETDSNE